VGEALFIFMQMEFPWPLGPAPGRYLLRSRETGEPERVIVLGSVGAPRAGEGRGGSSRRRRLGARARASGPGRDARPEPEPVALSRVTIIDPVPLSAEQQARAWLSELDREHDVQAAFATLNRVLHMHRIAAADPYVHEVAPAQALVIRAGWGAGEQVAEGRWLHASELPAAQGGRRFAGPRRRSGERSAALRPVERLASMLAARGGPLLCEELALRARLDLDEGRVRHAAVELERAYTAALTELRAEARADLALRISELEKLSEGVAAQARAALAEYAPRGPAQAGHCGGAGPDEETVAHALGRLEAALRARAAGSSLSR
jgi:hypothetical protein